MRMSIKYKLAILMNVLVIALAFLLSVLFYIQFRSALNQRVLLQLSSIKQLKMVQILDYLEQSMLTLSELNLQNEAGQSVHYDSTHQIWLYSGGQIEKPESEWIQAIQSGEDGIYDLSHSSTQGRILLAFKHTTTSGETIAWLTHATKIQDILLERTGMGETGETYIVGSDSTLRSISRFFPEKAPTTIEAATEGVIQAMRGRESTGIFPDYRSVMVFSAYGPMHYSGLDWNILSEMDQHEAMVPLVQLQKRLIVITVLVVVVMALISFYLATRLVRPLKRMQELLSEMSLGNFKIKFEKTSGGDEIEDMFEALDRLVLAINQAMDFANDVGQLHLDREYKPLSDQDALGKSLLQMRDKLKAFNEQEEKHQLQRQKALVQGQEKERARLSRELHDGLGPLLTSLKLYVQRIEMDSAQKIKIKQILDDTITEVRRMSYNLMPQALIDFGVGDAITKLVNIIQESTDIDIKYQNAMKSQNTLGAEMNIAIYRMAQEILNNAVKHSQASEVRLSLTEFDDFISLFFQDDGIGFDPNEMNSGSGLLNLRERCRILQGNFQIDSNADGTTIEIEIPVKND